MSVAGLILVIAFFLPQLTISQGQTQEYAVFNWYKPRMAPEWSERSQNYNWEEWKHAPAALFTDRCKSLQLFALKPGKPRELFDFEIDGLLRRFGIKPRDPQWEWIKEVPQRECMRRHQEFVAESGEARIQVLLKRRLEFQRSSGIPRSLFEDCGMDQHGGDKDCGARRLRQDAIEEFLRHDLTAQVCASYLAPNSDNKSIFGACVTFPIPNRRHVEWKSFLALIVPNWSKSLLKGRKSARKNRSENPLPWTSQPANFLPGTRPRKRQYWMESKRVLLAVKRWLIIRSGAIAALSSAIYLLGRGVRAEFMMHGQDKLNILHSSTSTIPCVWRGKEQQSRHETRRYCNIFPSDCG